MPKYRKRPIAVEVVQWTGDNFDEITEFASGRIERRPNSTKLFIPTLEGTMRAKVGDWIIRGVQGEFYACDAAIFEETYEPVEA